MPIQIPQLKRIDPQAPISVGRLDANIPSGARDLSQTTSALTELGMQAIKYRNQVADQQADTVATTAENEFEQRWKIGMYGDPESGALGLKYQKGNPTDLYKGFDDTMEGHLKELSSNDKWDTETQNLVNRRLGYKAQQLQLQTLTEYGAQQTKYDDSQTSSGVKLNQDALPDATTYIHPGDDSTFGPLQGRLKAIRDLRIAQAIRYGSAQEDVNGEASYTTADGTVKNVTLGPSVQLQIKKDMSEGLYQAMDNLIKTGALDKAEAMKEKYNDYLDPIKRNRIAKEFEAADVKSEAFDLADQAKGKSPDQIAKLLDGVSPEIRHKSLQYISDNLRYQENIRKQSEQANYRTLWKQTEAFKMKNPEATQSDLEAQPFYAHLWRNVNPGQLKSTHDIVAPPKVSDQKSLSRVQNVLAGNDPEFPDVRSIPPERQAEILSGLNQSDRTYWGRKLGAFTSQTGAQETQQHQHAMQELKSQAFNLGMIRADNGFNSDVQKGGSEAAKLGQFQIEFTHTLDKRGPMSPTEIQDAAVNFLIAKSKGQNFALPPKPKFQGNQNSPSTETSGAPPASPVQSRAKALKDFTGQNGRPPTAKELDSYISSDKSGRYK